MNLPKPKITKAGVLGSAKAVAGPLGADAISGTLTAALVTHNLKKSQNKGKSPVKSRQPRKPNHGV